MDNDGNLDDNSRIDALASDNIILYSLLNLGVKGSGTEGELLYIKKRSGYTTKGYTIFPSKEYPSPNKSDNYLPRLNTENYAIAIRKGTPNEDWLSQIISDSLDTLDIPGSDLNNAKKILENIDNPPPIIPPITPPEPKKEVNTDRWWIPIVTALVAAFTSIIVAILNPQFISTIRDWLRVSPPPVTPSSSKKITGRVLNTRTRKYIAGVKVSLESNNTRHFQYTDSEGSFSFYFDHSCNRILLRFEADDYKIYDRWIDTPNNEQKEEIGLSPNSIE